MGEGQLAEGEATDAEVDLHAPSPRQSRGTLAAAAHQAGGGCAAGVRGKLRRGDSSRWEAREEMQCHLFNFDENFLALTRSDHQLVSNIQRANRQVQASVERRTGPRNTSRCSGSILEM